MNDDNKSTKSIPFSKVRMDELDQASKYLKLAEIIFIALDKKGVILAANDKAASIVGYNLDELIGKNWVNEFVPSDIRNEIREALEQSIEEASLIDEAYTNPILTRNSDELQISWKGVPIVDEQENAIGIFAFGDLTPDLKASQNRFEAILEGIDAGVLLLQPDNFKIIEANPAAHSLLDYAEGQLVGESAIGILCPDDIPECSVVNCTSSQDTKETSALNIHGQEIPVARSCKLVEVNGIEYIAISFIDISEQLKIEDRLKTSEQKYKDLISNLNDGVGIVDLDENLVFVNEAYTKITGYTREELLDMSVYDLVPPSERMTIKKQSVKRKNSVSSVYDVKIERKDGTEVVTRVSAVPRRDKSGKTIGTIAVVSDISERRRVEKAIRIQRDLSNRLGRASSFNEVARALIDACFHINGIDSAALYLRNEETEEYDLIDDKCRLLSCAQMPEWVREPFESINEKDESQSLFIDFDNLNNAPSWINPNGFSAIGIATIELEGESQGFLYVGSSSLKSIPLQTRNLLETITNISGGVIGRIGAIERLKASEARYRELVNLLPEGVMIADLNEQIILANNAMAEILGRPLSEIEGNYFDMILSDEQREQIRKQTEKRSKGISSTYDLVIERPDGTERNLRVSAVPRMDHNKEVTGAIGVFVDVTEARRREKELERLTTELNDRVRQFEVLYMTSGLFSDSSESMDDVIEALLSTVGEGFRYPESVSIRINLSGVDYESPGFHETEWNLRKPVICSGKPRGAIAVFYDQEFPELEVGPFLKSEATMLGIVATEFGQFIVQREASEQLKTQKNRLQAITNSNLDGIVTIDDERRITFWNPAAERIFGYSKNEVLGKNFIELLVPTDLKNLVAKGYQKFAENGTKALESPILEVTGVRKDGSRFPAELSIAPVRYGNRHGSVTTVRDITERKRNEQQKELQRKELEMYSSILRHDLLNDLGVVLGYLEAAEMSLKSNKKDISEFLSSSNAALMRMESILKAITKPIEETYDTFNQLIEIVAERAKESSLDADIEITSEEDTKDLMIKGAKLVHIIFDNLFRNSIQHAGDNAIINVHIKREESNLVIIVSDNGPGIEEDIRNSIFQKGTSTTGGGFGLYLSKEVARISGGDISLLPPGDNRGAAFRVELPIAETR